ncbi:MAG: hypothetical protein P8Y81_00290 [Ignavibacteriaceae bacterium]
MKKIVLTLFIMTFICGVNIFAQSDSTKAKSKELKQKRNTEQIMKTFEKPGRKKDQFIDKDGDGISDNRAEGMSFQKMRKRKYHGGEGHEGGSGGRGQGGNGGSGGGGK